MIKGVAAEGWFTDADMNQAMRFGTLPVWATNLAETLPVHLFTKQVDS